jgi:uncharacterized membrane protein YqhA
VPSVEKLVLVIGFLLIAGAFIAVQIGMWKAFISIFKDSRRRGWFKSAWVCEQDYYSEGPRPPARSNA